MLISKPKQHYDIAVIGGGLVGSSFACAIEKTLAAHGLSVLVVEAFASSASDSTFQPSFDARSTALSFGSKAIFDKIGLWDDMAAAASVIKEIHISDKDRFGSAQLKHSEHGVDALGYVIENREIGTVLTSALHSSNTLELLAPAKIDAVRPISEGMELTLKTTEAEFEITASLVVLAEGGKSPVCKSLGIAHKTEDYEQHAMIANVAFEKPHNNIAFERFTDTGPLAVLPLPSHQQESGDVLNRCSLVWTVTAAESAEFMAMDVAALKLRLQERFGTRLGVVEQIGERFCYPLSLSVAREQIRPGLVLLGNVAHTIHPVAGQGLNLSLRDTQVLVDLLAQACAAGESLGEMKLLQNYLDQRTEDQDRAITFTHQITRLFSSNSTAKVLLRKLGLFSVDLVPPLRQSLAEQAMGLGGK